MHNILVVGGAGYIGSHMVLELHRAGFHPIVLDNLSKGHADAVDAKLIIGNLADRNLLSQIFTKYHIRAVMHFASYIEVAESVKQPIKYYDNNVSATIQLLCAMQEHGVKNFIFSSTAAVYGNPQAKSITEDHPTMPINPYGHSKLMVEQIIKDMGSTGDINYFIFRYFNAAGADPEGKLAERHHPESHLIPLILQAANGDRTSITVNGNDYPTQDGTCVRDYIHVGDLCHAHLLGLQQLLNSDHKNEIYNLGSEKGYTVLEVIEAAKRITKVNFPVKYGPRRAGDPAVLVANATKAQQELGWQRKYEDIYTIIKDACKAAKKEYVE